MSPNRSVGRLLKGVFALRHLFRPDWAKNFKSFDFGEVIGSTSYKVPDDSPVHRGKLGKLTRP
jgi:hypothetical protein